MGGGGCGVVGIAWALVLVVVGGLRMFGWVGFEVVRWGFVGGIFFFCACGVEVFDDDFVVVVGVVVGGCRVGSLDGDAVAGGYFNSVLRMSL